MTIARKILLPLFVFSIGSIAGCKHSKDALPRASFHSVVLYTPPKFPVAEMPTLYAPFTPTKHDLRIAEKILKEVFAKDFEPLNQENHFKLQQYTRQYFGFSNAQKEKVIFVRCFLKSDYVAEEYWRKHFYDMDDGCEGLFSVFINIGTGAYSGFQINPCA